MSAQPTRRKSPRSRANRAANGAQEVVDATTEEVQQNTVAKRLTPQERREQRAEAKRTARTASEKTERSGGIAGRVISSERSSGVRKFVRETRSEIQKVTWPDRETTRNLVAVVIAVSTALGLLLGGLDYVLFQIFEALS